MPTQAVNTWLKYATLATFLSIPLAAFGFMLVVSSEAALLAGLLTGFFVLIPTIASYQAYGEWVGGWQNSELQQMDARKKLLVWLIAFPGLILSPLLITLSGVAVGITALVSGIGGKVWRQHMKEARKRKGEGRLSRAVEQAMDEALQKYGF